MNNITKKNFTLYKESYVSIIEEYCKFFETSIRKEIKARMEKQFLNLDAAKADLFGRAVQHQRDTLLLGMFCFISLSKQFYRNVNEPLMQIFWKMFCTLSIWAVFFYGAFEANHRGYFKERFPSVNLVYLLVFCFSILEI